MLNMDHDEWRHSRVTVAFADGPLSFLLSKDATFEDLADRLQRLGERHRGKPIAIDIKLAVTPGDRRRRCATILDYRRRGAHGAAGGAINSDAVVTPARNQSCHLARLRGRSVGAPTRRP
jgi:hypothetical protein